jgi:K+-sensing histidine kinase KdpD
MVVLLRRCIVDATISAPKHESSMEDALRLVELAEEALRAQSFEGFVEGVLPAVAGILRSRWALLYVSDARLAAPRFFQHGLEPGMASAMERLCAEHLDRVANQPGLQPITVPGPEVGAPLDLYPLKAQEGVIGLVGLLAPAPGTPPAPDHRQRLLSLLANAINRLTESVSIERQVAHLNTYMTVSSLIAQPLSLHELLEIALYCCMEAVAAEAASVLLLDDEGQSFRFYQVAGPQEPVLEGATFTANEGIAGAILQTQQSAVINDVYGDARFYRGIDAQTGFQTRNMIAVPLTAGEKPVGVLEVLNKASGEAFTEEEHLLLLSVAEEIATAIRNAIVFEYVVNSYCKQRQGQLSCKGCERPLGEWTPCVKYRETEV